ncbi:T-complex protein 11-like protein 2 [Hydra vulgaris]|uniref:T-complex protein 11-like protein 2 n=1 Tax=Hydra vulgaris TaxID=6087 RepID=A0ABM4D1V6_HYDVU
MADLTPNNAELSENIFDIIKNMALAHEMVISDNFKFNHISEQPEAANSLEKTVHDIVHAAFWDILQSEVSSEPPKYEKAFMLLMEMKQMILELVPSKQSSLLQEIQETLDQELIFQQIANNAFDIVSLGNFVLETLSKLCAPVRDDEIKKLRNTQEIIPLLRGILELLNLMKIDLANYQLKALKPVLIQQAVSYEREKFEECMKVNPEGLKMTKLWLSETLQSLAKKVNVQELDCEMVTINAFLSLIEFKKEMIYPETLLLDECRLQALADSFDKLSFISAIMTLYVNFIGAGENLTLLDKIKEEILIIFGNNERTTSLLENVYHHLIFSLDKLRTDRGLQPKGDTSLLLGQIKNLANKDDSFRKLITSRFRDFVLLTFSGNVIPSISGCLHWVQTELKMTTESFVRICKHNKNVHQERYNKIIDIALNDLRQSLVM